jgi:hypothetical protein
MHACMATWLVPHGRRTRHRIHNPGEARPASRLRMQVCQRYCRGACIKVKASSAAAGYHPCFSCSLPAPQNEQTTPEDSSPLQAHVHAQSIEPVRARHSAGPCNCSTAVLRACTVAPWSPIFRSPQINQAGHAWGRLFLELLVIDRVWTGEQIGVGLSTWMPLFMVTNNKPVYMYASKLPRTVLATNWKSAVGFGHIYSKKYRMCSRMPVVFI